MHRRTNNSFGYTGVPVKPEHRRPTQNINRTSSGHRTHGVHGQNGQRRKFPTNYYGVLRRDPPPLPQGLGKSSNGDDEVGARKKEFPGLGKVKIMLRVNRVHGQSSKQEFIRVEGNKKHVSVFVPEEFSKQPNARLAPKVYAFDSIFTEQSSQSEICKTSLVDVIQSVLQGADGTVFCYGQANLGKTYALLGGDDDKSNLGLLPCAISWLYRAMQGTKKVNRCSVKVSAIEVYGRSEKLRDLLAGYCEDGPSNALAITEDPLLGTKLQNQCEIQAETAERAAYLLDAALASRSCAGSRNTSEARKHSHVVYTLHMYHHRSENNDGRCGDRSRLHFVDLGSCDKTLIKTPNALALSLTSLGHVIMSILNNSKHVPFRDSKLTCVLKETLANVNCRVVMLAHVSSDVTQYSDTLSTIQLASRIHRVIKKKTKSSMAGPGGSSSHLRSKYLRQKSRDSESVGSSSGMECTSGSELSCDTVVYVNKNGVPMSDRELTDNEGPPVSLPVQPRGRCPTVSSPLSDNEMVYNLGDAEVRPVKGCVRGMGGDGQAMGCVQSPGSEGGRSKIPSRVKNCKSKLPRHNSNLVKTDTIESHKQRRTECIAARGIHSRSSTAGSEHQHAPSRENHSQSKLQNPGVHPVTSDVKSVSKPNKPPRSNSSSLDKRKTAKSAGDVSLGHPHKPSTRLTKPKQSLDYSNGIQQSRPSSAQSRSSCRKTAPPPPKRSSSVAASRERRNNEQVKHSSRQESKNENHNSKVPLQSKLVAPRTRIGATDGKNSIGKCRIASQSSKKSNIHTYENVHIPAFPNAQDERPEPVGCDEETALASSCLGRKAESKKMEKEQNSKRSESMYVNLDDGDWEFSDEDHENSKVVDVNFYCLTFTSRNPLVPLSRRRFSQQIEQNRRKSDASDGQSIEIDSEYETQKKEDAEKIIEDARKFALNLEEMPLTAKAKRSEDDFSLKEKPSEDDRNMQIAAWCQQGDGDYSDVDDDNELGDDVFTESEIKKMPKLECSYTHNDRSPIPMSTFHPFNQTPAHVSRSGSQASDIEHRRVVYDSNSLEMSYLDTRQWLADSPELRKTSYESPSRRLTPKKQIATGASKKSVLITKSTSQEGARLTLIKKKKGGGSTLELMITDEEPNPLTDREHLVNCNPSNAEVRVLEETNKLKRSRWSGLRKLSMKSTSKSPKKTSAGKSFVSKILTPKLRRSGHSKQGIQVR
nr:kinesin-like protein KIF26B [Ciona intestinalis]|eukprot:XP_018669453.2 kinesin-like protein KIF26B [Ciona intestinalis]